MNLDPDSDQPNHSRWRGLLILTLVSMLMLGAIWQVADVARWPRDRALWIGFGVSLAFMTLARPWWFWEDRRARWLRRLIGDELTTMVYLGVAGGMVWVGVFTDWTFGRR